MPLRMPRLPDPAARPRLGRHVLRLAQDQRLQFIGINLAVNLLMLGRSYLAMRLLDERALGYVTLVQTLILFVSALQLGMLQGGFRLLCNGESEDRDAINGHYYAFQAMLSVLALVALAWLAVAGTGEGWTAIAVAGTGLLAGIATLNRSWVSNQLIAKGALAEINGLTLLTAILALLPLLAMTVAPLEAVLASMFAQPLLFAAMALYRHADMRPRRFQLDRELLRRIMAAGFLVFLSGMLLQLGTLLERWFVGSVLGIETLGQLYLVILFTTLFQIVPTALDNVMLPRAIELSRTGQTSALRRTMRYFLLAIALYCAGVAGAVGLFAEPVLSLLVPERVGDLRHVHAILPGLVAFTMASPVAISFNVLIDYRGYMLAYGGGTLLTAVVLGLGAGRLLHLDIDAVMILRSACYGLMAAVLVAMFLQVSRRHPAFRFWRQ